MAAVEKAKNVVLMDIIIDSLLKAGNKTANINVKNCSLYTVDGDGSITTKIIKKGNVNHTNCGCVQCLK